MAAPALRAVSAPEGWAQRINDKSIPAGGGGGLGAGGDVFVQQGGQLTIGSASLGAGTVAGGGPGEHRRASEDSNPATGGSAFGSGIFIQGNQSITFPPSSGLIATISGVIAGQKGSSPAAAVRAAWSSTAPARSILQWPITYTGGTTIKNGTLELAVPTAAGTGNIAFAGASTLRINSLAGPANIITGFGTANTIDLARLSFAAPATASDHRQRPVGDQRWGRPSS